MSIPLQRVASLRRRAQANAPAASQWSRRVLYTVDDGGRSGVLGWGVYAGIRRIPTSGGFWTAYTHLSDDK